MTEPYKDQASWIRIFLVLVFGIIFYIAQFVVGAVALAQCVFALITGQPNDQLLKFGDSLGKYVHDILRFVTFNSDHRPFPFSDFPEADKVIPAN